MHSARFKTLALAAALALAAGGSLAQDASSGTASGSTSSSGATGSDTGGARGVGPKSLQDAQGRSAATQDHQFMQRAAVSGLFELEAARLAAEKAQDEAVKRYAAMLVEQHTAANQELSTLAQSKGQTLPTTLPMGKRRELERMGRLSGAAFDSAFVQNVGIREHRQDIRQFREVSRRDGDPELKAWANKMLPTLEQHLSQAQALPAARRPAAEPKGSTGGTGS